MTALPEVHAHLIDKLAFVNAFVSGVTLYPQLIKTALSGNFAGLAISTFVLIFLNSSIWIFYSFHRRLVSLFIASLLNAIASGLTLLIIVFH